jgi:hypothetical protein
MQAYWPGKRRILHELLTAEREEVRKIHNMSFRHPGKNNQYGENSHCEFFGHVSFLQLAIHIGLIGRDLSGQRLRGSQSVAKHVVHILSDTQ